MMKVITDYFSPPSGGPKTMSPTLRQQNATTRIKTRQKTRRNIGKKGNSKIDKKDDSENEEEAFYDTRKIRIRLADPNVTDSYICEVYDTSPSLDDYHEIYACERKDEPIPIELNGQKKSCNVKNNIATESNAQINEIDSTPSSGVKSLKRRRSLARGRMKIVKDSDSSSDEALVSVKKRLKISRAVSVGDEPSQTPSIVKKSVEISPSKSLTPVKSTISASAERPKRSTSGKKKVWEPSTDVKPAKPKQSVQRLSKDTRLSKTAKDVIKTVREKQVAAALPNIKTERLERWRSVIRQNCAKSVNENESSPLNSDTVETPKENLAEYKSNVQITPEKVTPPVVKKEVRKKRAKSQTLAIINNELNVPNDRPKKASYGIQQYLSCINNKKCSPVSQGKANRKSMNGKAKNVRVTKLSTPNKEELPRNIKDVGGRNGLLSPTKECRVVLEKTPLKALGSPAASPQSTPTPTKECSVVLEKLTPITKARTQTGNKKAVPLAPIFQKKNKTVKVAPIFEKQSKEIDPEVLKARRAFLQSGVPTFMRKKIEKPRAEQTSDEHFFPAVTHVQQRSGELEWVIREVELSLLPKFDHTDLIAPQWKKRDLVQALPSIALEVLKLTLNESQLDGLKSSYVNVKIDTMFEMLRERHEEFRTQSTELLPVWTEKYKPESNLILSNDRSVAKLRKWLNSWRLYGQELRDGVRRRARSNSGSSDDFVSSDEEEHRHHRAPATACLLHGPVSSGKTALVQALATELDFHVLEVNSSSKRSGKKMLADLLESTQSHKILQDARGTLSQAGDVMSMIVVEEADVVFDDHDEGFVSGLQNLILTAKRPVVIVTSDVTAPHLDKFRSSSTLQLAMTRPKANGACAFLELICILEGYKIPRTFLTRLLHKNQNDLRKSLLELQFWIENGVTHLYPETGSLPMSSHRLWWASNKSFFTQDLWHSTINPCPSVNDSEKSSEKPVKPQRYEFIKKFRSYAESMAILDVISAKCAYSSVLDRCSYRAKDGTSLEDRRTVESAGHVKTGEELQEEIELSVSRLLPQTKGSTNIPLLIPHNEARWLSTMNKATEELKEVVPQQTATYARCCDYLPALRSMCRTEKTRVANNFKRTNRFYHYLRTLGATPTQSNLDINCTMLKIPDI